jgi:hypothetical protein
MQAQKVRAGIRNTVNEIDWLKKKNNMLIERDWLNMLVDRGEDKVVIRHSSRPSRISQPHTWTLLYCFFINEDANVNNGRGRKWIHASAGLRATCLSRGRRRI